MPVERSSQRLDARLGRRDKAFLATLACAGAAAIGAGAYVYSGSGSGATRKGCVSVTFPSTMGGATVRECGAAADRFCRVESPRAAVIATACHRAGFATSAAG